MTDQTSNPGGTGACPYCQTRPLAPRSAFCGLPECRADHAAKLLGDLAGVLDAEAATHRKPSVLLDAMYPGRAAYADRCERDAADLRDKAGPRG